MPNPARRPQEGALRSAALVLGATAAITLAATAGAWPPDPVPAAPARTVADVPAPPAPPEAAPVTLPENWQQLAASLTLADIVDIALANNEDTRGTWLAARSAAADLGAKRGEYYPQAELDASATRSKIAALGGRYDILQSDYGPTLNLSYLLLDFGGRSARVDQAKAALYAADWQHNAMIQNVILAVQQAYYAYLDAKAQLAAAQANVKEASTNLDAAHTRHDAGVATIADVLQAQTALSQAELTRQTVAGQIETLRGALATSMGVPANTPFDVGELPSALPAASATEAADTLIAKAVASRPDLAASRWQAAKSDAKTREMKAQGLPTISLSANAARTYFVPNTYADYANTWSAGLAVRIPLFTGFTDTWNVRKAQADAEVSRSQARRAEQQVILDVWTARSDLETATQRVATSKDLLASAQESERVALARYKEGVGSVIDLLNAQAALSSARAQEIQARTDWLLAVSRLAYATGTLQPTTGEAPAPSPSKTVEKQP